MDVKVTRRQAKEGVSALAPDEPHRIEIDSRCLEVAILRQHVPRGRSGHLELTMGGATLTSPLNEGVAKGKFLSFRFFSLEWGAKASVALVLEETNELSAARIVLLQDAVVTGEISADTTPDGGIELERTDDDPAPEAADFDFDSDAAHAAFMGEVRETIAAWVVPYSESRGMKIVSAGKALVGKLVWGGEEGQSCYTSPFYFALKSDVITEDQYDTLHYIMGPDALRVSAEKAADDTDCYPARRPRPGEMVLIIPPLTGNTPAHVAVATGNASEILSLEPSADDDDSDEGTLQLTTIEDYLARYLQGYETDRAAWQRLKEQTKTVILPFPYGAPPSTEEEGS